MIDLATLPKAMQAKRITVVAEAWEGVLFVAQSADDQLWRVWACFGDDVQVISEAFPAADAALPAFLGKMDLIAACARHFYERGRLAAIPVPPAPGTKPTLTLV